jgi:Holliday junction resolvase
VVGLGARARHRKGASPLTQYRRGTDFERQTKKKLEADGWTVVKSGGSKGQMDLVAFKAGQPVLLIQCTIAQRAKSKATERALIDLADDLASVSAPTPVIAERGKPFRFLREEREAA